LKKCGKKGISVPKYFEDDLEKGIVVMAYVDGMTVKKYLDNNFDQDEIVGRSLGLLVGQVESCKNGHF